MTFLAPWALALGATAALGMVVIHLVAWQRPAAFVLPTTRFIPDERTVVSRAATRPQDLVLLALRVLLLLAAAAAFARPVLTPSEGSRASIVLLDRSSTVRDMAASVSLARARLGADDRSLLIVFDTAARVVSSAALDSLAGTQSSEASLSAALALARRHAATLATDVDSISLVIISPIARSAIDSATLRLRGSWPGPIALERVALRTGNAPTWSLEDRVPVSDALGPATAILPTSLPGLRTRLVRTPPSVADTAFARDGNTIVRWDSTTAGAVAPRGVVAGEEVVLGTLGARELRSDGHAVASWADGSVAATETPVGNGCIRDVGIVVPSAGDLALHAPMQRIIRRLLGPCGGGTSPTVTAADSVTVRQLAGGAPSAVASSLVRSPNAPPTPLVKWLLGLALFLAVAELFARTFFRSAVQS